MLTILLFCYFKQNDKAGIETKDESKLPPIIEAKTGEEDEDIIVNITPAKLYKLEEEEEKKEEEGEKKEEEPKKEEGEGEKKEEKEEEKKDKTTTKVKRWAERCLGSFKVNVDKKTSKARVIMRTEHTLNTRLNALILSSSKCTMDSNGRAFIFSTFEVDTESEDKTASFNIYMIRFNSKEKATSAFEAVTKQIEEAKKREEQK